MTDATITYTYNEEAEFDVEVTLTFRTNVCFAAIDRNGPITNDDAIANFYGYGLDELIETGEYDVSGYELVKVKRTA